MLIKTRDHGFIHPVSSEITPQGVYQRRRDLLRLLAGGAAGTALAGWAARDARAELRSARLAGQKSSVAGAATM